MRHNLKNENGECEFDHSELDYKNSISARIEYKKTENELKTHVFGGEHEMQTSYRMLLSLV